MRITATTLSLAIATFSWSQTTVKGIVSDENGQAVPGANVFVKGSFDGSSSNDKGVFSFKTTEQGQQTLITSFIGFETKETIIDIKGTTVEVNVSLEEKVSEMEAVTVTAGSFEASDEKKAVMLKPIDIVTVAGSVGDIMGALSTLPGAQRSGDDGMLVVRGGDASETKTFIDGTCVDKPYSSNMPDLPARGRFSPMLFKGTMFSTGGFSAQYGQSLSAIIQLESVGLAEKTQASLSIMSVGMGASACFRSDSSSATTEIMYANMGAYYSLTRSNIPWTEYPHSLSNISTFRKKIGTKGMLKTMIQASSSTSGMLYEDLDARDIDTMKLRDGNIYMNNSYLSPVGKHAILNVSSGGMIDNEKMHVGEKMLHTTTISASTTIWMKQYINKNSLKYGVQYSSRFYKQHYVKPSDSTDVSLYFSQPLTAAFIELEYVLSKKILVKPGLRHEYSSQNTEHTLQPRVSAAYKTSTHGQVSLAWGIFRQLQCDDYVKFNNTLASSQAVQYIANYQNEYNGRMFRSEVYAKRYNKLARYSSLNNPDPTTYNTTGEGYAYGLDLFFRDTRTIPNGDFWITYSFIETRRNYQDYEEMAQPDYVSPHSFSIVYKQLFPRIQTQFGLSYNFTSSKCYNDPNQDEFMASHLPSTSDLCLCFSYLTRILGKLVIVHGSVSNILGFDQIYGYRFASEPDENGIFRSVQVGSVAKRMFFLGIFFNF